jgi:hypothetical protein
VIRLTGTIIYRDGRREPFEASGSAQAEWEAYAHRHGLPLTPTQETLPQFPGKTWQMFMAYASLELEEGFDAWRRTVVDVEGAEEAEAVPPTLEAVTVEPWSSSRSASDGG